MHGPDPSLDLTPEEKLVLAVGGTLGVVGFVVVPDRRAPPFAVSVRARFGATRCAGSASCWALGLGGAATRHRVLLAARR